MTTPQWRHLRVLLGTLSKHRLLTMHKKSTMMPQHLQLLSRRFMMMWLLCKVHKTSRMFTTKLRPLQRQHSKRSTTKLLLYHKKTTAICTRSVMYTYMYIHWRYIHYDYCHCTAICCTSSCNYAARNAVVTSSFVA